ncbi:MAG: L,D-transpeptidase family protein [Desulfobacterales bacterium]
MRQTSKIYTLLLFLLFSFAGIDAGRANAPEALPAAEALRVVKSERKLYLLRDGEAYKSYCISLGSRPVGDKVQAGDKRTPEGRYIIDWRNLESNYHRALHISYPDAADRQEAQARGVDPGGMIMIHGLPNKARGETDGYVGMDWTDGCIAVTNAEIEELIRVVKDGTPIEILP